MAARTIRYTLMALIAVAIMMIGQSSAMAQSTPDSGVQIDAEGTLHRAMTYAPNSPLVQQRAAAAKAALNKEIQQKSNFRIVSLTRLEKEAKKLIDAGQPLPPEMKYLAGLTKVSHVFYYPETKDVVIAGPAEGFFQNHENRVVGLESGRAILQLQDLVVALRAYGPEGKKTRMIACSIDPTQEGLAKMKQAYANVLNSGQFRPGAEGEVVKLFSDSLGMQNITVRGISPKTNFARVIVEADYHMKLIGIGLENPPVKITSFIDRANPTAVAKNSLQRWFFQPNYECISVSEDETAMEIMGQGVKLVGEDESIMNDGQRVRQGRANRASTAFTNSFTKMYAKLAEKSALFGELRNVIDLSMVAAFIQEMDLYGQAEWSLETFGDESVMPVEVYNAPTKVAPAINAVWKGRYFMTPIGGGVVIQPRQALKVDNLQADEKGAVLEAKNLVQFDNVELGQWWWDVEKKK